VQPRSFWCSLCTARSYSFTCREHFTPAVSTSPLFTCREHFTPVVSTSPLFACCEQFTCCEHFTPCVHFTTVHLSWAFHTGLCLYAVSPFSDRISGTVTVRYGSKPYNTVKMKLLYGSGTVRSRSTVFWPFCREKGGPGFEPWSEPHFLLFPPIYFLCVSS
jgi:hypothetical protein